jgi:hypothetical protein
MIFLKVMELMLQKSCKDNLKFSLIIKPSDENAVFFLNQVFQIIDANIEFGK